MFKSININEFRQFSEKELFLGKYITVLAGRNSTGKSTILSLLGNSSELKKKTVETYTQNQFRAEFSEIIKGSKEFDKTGSNLFQITVLNADNKEVVCDFRTTWQKYGKDDETAERFRLIPKWTKDDGNTTEAKLERPVLYLGLSRLFPIGESQKIGINKPKIRFDNEQHKKWFIENYTRILSINEKVQSVTSYTIGETDKKSGVGVTTEKYDYLTNSSGQDNLGQILLSILSFKRAYEKMKSDWKGGLLLIDEIDATLHPVAQNRLLDLLIKEAKNSQFQVVFTTHSISLLKYVAEKTEHNGDDPNQNIELYYFTTANRKLDIIRNAALHTMENDLMIQGYIQNNKRVKVYSEDAETRWLFRLLIGKYESNIDILDVQVGCQSLMTMYKSDPEYFTRTLIVLDGDVTEETLSTVPKPIRDKYRNILLLPGKKRPEQVIYEYILGLEPDHEFWNLASEYDMTWQYFKDNGPDSPRYKKEKDRDKYKAWFMDHVQFFDLCMLGEYWIRDNVMDAEIFLENFKLGYNAVARRTFANVIKE